MAWKHRVIPGIIAIGDPPTPAETLAAEIHCVMPGIIVIHHILLWVLAIFFILGLPIVRLVHILAQANVLLGIIVRHTLSKSRVQRAAIEIQQGGAARAIAACVPLGHIIPTLAAHIARHVMG